VSIYVERRIVLNVNSKRLETVHINTVYTALLLSKNKKGSDYFSPLRCVSLHREAHSCLQVSNSGAAKKLSKNSKCFCQPNVSKAFSLKMCK
jgi:hypothetical protein